MPGRNTQMSLWWSGEAESMFVYYLTGAVGICFLASFLITRSMRRKEPLVTELLHEENNRDELVSYMLQITTSVTSGSGCPRSAKVFMQLNGHLGRSQYFHLRSFTGGKPMFQRGFTDIFLFKVPGRVGEIQSANLFVSGLKTPLIWRIEGARLYHPASGLRKHLPLNVSFLENVSDDQVNTITNNARSNLSARLGKCLLVYHQWFAIYGNKIRLGAFTESVSMMCLFLSILSMLILSQMTYIVLPRETVNPIEDEDSGTFKLTPSSFIAGSLTAAMLTAFLVLGIEVLLRNVKSKEKQTGLAYEKICNEISRISRKSVESLTDNKMRENLESREQETPVHQTFNNEQSRVPQISKKSLTDAKVHENARSTDRKTGLAYKTLCKKTPCKTKISIESLTDDTLHEKPFVYPAFHLHLLKEEDLTIMHIGDEKGIEVDSGMPLPLKLLISFLEKEHNEKEEHWNALADSASISIPSFNALSLNDWLVSETFPMIPRRGYLESLKQKRTNNTKRRTKTDKKLTVEVDCDTEASYNTLQEVAMGRSLPSKRKYNTLNRNREDIAKKYKAEDIGTLKQANVTRLSDISVQMELGSDDEFFTVLPHESIYFKRFGKFKRTDDRIHKHIQQRWQAAQKIWSRNFVRDLCDIIARVRLKLLPTTFDLDIASFSAMLMNICRSTLQQLIVCCTLQSPPEHHSLLVGKEIAALMSHLAMEVILKTVREIFLLLEKTDCATLVDLVLVSDSVINTVHFTSLLVLYMVHHGKAHFHLLKSVSLAKDAQCVMTDVLKGCFALVVKYNLISWHQLKILLEEEVKKQLQEICYTQIKDFVKRNIQNSSAEDVAVKRLCRYVEEKSKQEVWEELSDEKFMFTNNLLKSQLINLMTDKIENLKKKKHSFDDKNDLLPKEPKSRVELMLEKRRPAIVSVNNETNKTSKGNTKHLKKHVIWNLIKGHAEKRGLIRREAEKHSHELGILIENLTHIQDLLKKFLARQGLKFRDDTERLLAQATLHPHVVIPNTPGNSSKIEGLYNLNNFLQLKKTENLVAQSFEITSEELIEFLLKSVENGWNLQGQLLETDKNNIVIEILIKLDTLVESLVDDVDIIMHRCVKNEPYIEMNKQKGSVRSLVKTSVENLVKKSSLHRWSSTNIYGSNMSKKEDKGKDRKKVFFGIDTSNQVYNTRSRFAQNLNNNQKGEMEITNKEAKETTNKEANQIIRSNENTAHDDSHKDEKTPDLKDVIQDLKSLKNYLKKMSHGEAMRRLVTQIGYMKRSKSKREHICAAQINTMVDSYYMIEEGDESQILTESELYQLEHDCVGESKKPLPPLVKSVTLVMVAVLFFLIVLYTTLIGGQFTSTDLQEWMCYYLMSIVIYGMLCEPLRAFFLGWYMDRFNNKYDQLSIDRDH